MLALADPPQPTTGMIPGLKYPPEWHREEEAREQAWLNARIRKHMRHRLTPKCC
ncbi:hypothetical protein AB0G67_40115 [Streptomyces sp. NPDC021056]|uniref:hypothetical protein n=1 Tax=Streptomyces sp. NPDC021056 TaxID=3155012 RepID=UPI0033D13285